MTCGQAIYGDTTEEFELETLQNYEKTAFFKHIEDELETLYEPVVTVFFFVKIAPVNSLQLS